MALAIIGMVSLGASAAFMVASIPMMEQFYADMANKGKVYTNVKIGSGLALANETSFGTGGNTPYIALWDGQGHRIGRYAPDEDEKISDGTISGNIRIRHDDTEPEDARKKPEYMLVAMNHPDAICINFISVTDPNDEKQAWYGDVGSSCGGNWYQSRYPIGEKNYMPRCTWLDQNHSDKLKHRGMGIRLPDFAASDERAKQYQDNKDTMCNSQPRFWLYPDIKPNDLIPVFFPPPDYNTDLTDKDPSKIINNKGYPAGNPGMKIGSGSPTSPDSAESTDGPTLKRSSPELEPPVRRRWLNPPDSRFQGQLVMSSHDSHSAKVLCEHDHSAGPDFVSFRENLFCDMSTKKMWPLCDSPEKKKEQQAENSGDSIEEVDVKQGAAEDKGQQVQFACFDTETKSMRGAGPHRRDSSIPVKQYHKAEHWHEGNTGL
ncbi:MAG: hypothetical protein Q9181_004198 [Wetmoreana brouardii]